MFSSTFSLIIYLVCFDIVGWVAARVSGPQQLSYTAVVVICLTQSENNLRMVEMMPLPLIISCFIKIQNGCAFLWRSGFRSRWPNSLEQSPGFHQGPVNQH